MRLYLDSNVFIAALEGASDKGTAARGLLSRIDTGEITAITSELTIAEVLPRPLSEGQQELAGEHQRALASRDRLKVCPIAWEILLDSANLRADFNMSLPDAIHVATARAEACSAIVTEDRRLKLPQGLPVMRLGETTFP